MSASLSLRSRRTRVGTHIPNSYCRTKFCFRPAQPAAYEGASYFSSASSVTSRASKGLHFPDINVQEAQRVTPGQPANPETDIWVFGGSTLFNAEVPDSLTIATLLQAPLNREYPSRFRLRNFGATA